VEGSWGEVLLPSSRGREYNEASERISYLWEEALRRRRIYVVFAYSVKARGEKGVRSGRAPWGPAHRVLSSGGRRGKLWGAIWGTENTVGGCLAVGEEKWSSRKGAQADQPFLVLLKTRASAD